MRDRDEPDKILAGLPGVKMSSAHAGTLWCKGQAAELRLEPGDLISVTARLERSPPPEAALRIHRGLSGNLRFALASSGPLLMADTHLNGAAHLPATFRQIQESLVQARKAAGPSRTSGRGGAQGRSGAERLRSALEEIDEQALGERPVSRPDGLWELRPRFGQAVLPVLLEADAGGARLWRELLSTCAPEARSAVALEALRLNADLREVRLAAREQGIVVETRLHTAQLDASWLVRAAQAVAAAWNHAHPTVRALSEQADLSALFLRMFRDKEPVLQKGKQRWWFSKVSH